MSGFVAPPKTLEQSSLLSECVQRALSVATSIHGLHVMSSHRAGGHSYLFLWKKKIRWYNMLAAEGTRLVARPPNGSRCDVSTSHAFVIVAGHMKRGNVGQSKSGFWLQTAVSYTVVMTLHIWPWSTKLFPPSTRYFWWAIRSSEICILLERNGRRREFRDWTIIFFLQCNVVKRVKKIIHFLHWWYMVAHIVPQFFSFLARTYRWSTVLIKVYIIYT